MKKLTDVLYWIVMAIMVAYFAYSKGWILTNFESITAERASQMIESDDNITILDVRTIEEYQKGHLRDAKLIPVSLLKENLDKLNSSKMRQIIVYCQSGNRSISASRILESNGFTPFNVKGGIVALGKAGSAIVK